MSTDNNHNQAWEQLADESAKAFNAFAEFLHLGPGRSYNKLRIKLGQRSVRGIERFAKLYNWQIRAKAYDNYILEETTAQVRRNVTAMTNNYIKMLALPGITFNKENAKHTKELSKMSTKDLFQLSLQAVKNLPALAELYERFANLQLHEDTTQSDEKLQELTDLMADDVEFQTIIEKVANEKFNK